MFNERIYEAAGVFQVNGNLGKLENKKTSYRCPVIMIANYCVVLEKQKKNWYQLSLRKKKLSI